MARLGFAGLAGPRLTGVSTALVPDGPPSSVSTFPGDQKILDVALAGTDPGTCAGTQEPQDRLMTAIAQPSTHIVRRLGSSSEPDVPRAGAPAIPVRRGATHVDRLTLSVAEAAELIGISRALAYELVARGDLPSVRLGRRLVVPRVALLAMFDAPPPADAS